MDAWFAGYHPQLTAVVWIGYDTPRKLGDRETGGGLSLPVWIKYMETALRNLPIVEPAPPEGLVQMGGDWVYPEFAGSAGVSSLGGNSNANGPSEALPPEEERKRILDLFRN
jgi:penicillin-binding protein 1A